MVEAIISVETPPCQLCHRKTHLELDRESFLSWRKGWLDVDKAFPDMPEEVKELLVTGSHPSCWQEVWEDRAGMVERQTQQT